jgi:hypothetical protein
MVHMLAARVWLWPRVNFWPVLVWYQLLNIPTGLGIGYFWKLLWRPDPLVFGSKTWPPWAGVRRVYIYPVYTRYYWNSYETGIMFGNFLIQASSSLYGVLGWFFNDMRRVYIGVRRWVPTLDKGLMGWFGSQFFQNHNHNRNWDRTGIKLFFKRTRPRTRFQVPKP